MSKAVEIQIPELEVVQFNLTLVGLTPLIVHRWSEKSKKEMLDKQMKKASGAKKAKNPEQDFKDSLYVNDDGEYYFPTIGFKACAVSACRQVADLAMTQARQLFFVEGEQAIIKGSEPQMREDTVKLNGKTSDLRYRGEFTNWYTELLITHDKNAISTEQIINLFNIGGFSVGVGEWRPERSGQFGRFKVATEAEVKAIPNKEAA